MAESGKALDICSTVSVAKREMMGPAALGIHSQNQGRKATLILT